MGAIDFAGKGSMDSSDANPKTIPAEPAGGAGNIDLVGKGKMDTPHDGKAGGTLAGPFNVGPSKPSANPIDSPVGM